jgi:hypothetical protein
VGREGRPRGEADPRERKTHDEILVLLSFFLGVEIEIEIGGNESGWAMVEMTKIKWFHHVDTVIHVTRRAAENPQMEYAACRCRTLAHFVMFAC